MSFTTVDLPPPISIHWLLEVLREHPDGLGEYELLKRLRADGVEGFGMELFSDSLTLFRGHFRLFHALYQLREDLVADELGMLEVSPLFIRLGPWHPQQTSAIDQHDPMRDYYLEIANLETSREEVERMLGAFWSGFHARQRRLAALDLLGLEDPVDDKEILTTYRRLAMKHHPDRGGDGDRFKEIKSAMEMLRRA
jgi:DnaJ-domain-containing protein 1